MLTDELITFVFDGKTHLLIPTMKTWLEASRRFADFVDSFKDKIRKKIRTTQDQDTLFDLQLELETAYLLLQEGRLSLVYEPGLSEKVRRPDFAVNFTTSLTFMVEVTRIRAEKKNTPSELLEPTPPTNFSDRLTDTIFNKVGQLLPKHSNILIIGVENVQLTQNDLHVTMIRLQQRAERNDSNFLQRYGFRDRTEFFQHYQRLSEILVRGSALRPESRTVAWINPQAKHPLPPKVRTTLYRSHTV